jgi:hypothetical protein
VTIPPKKFNITSDSADLLGKLDENVQQQAMILAQHQGTLQGVFSSIAALQSTFQAWNATVIGVAAAVIGAFAIAVAILTAGYFDNAATIRTLSDKLDTLPDRIAKQVRSPSIGSDPIDTTPSLGSDPIDTTPSLGSDPTDRRTPNIPRSPPLPSNQIRVAPQPESRAPAA